MRVFFNQVRPPRVRSIGLLLVILLVNGCATHQHIITPEPVSEQPPDQIQKKRFPYRTTQGAHRGDSILHVENTREAIRSARKNPKYEFIEFDVQYTADKHPVVFHDVTLYRIFGLWNKVKDTSYADLCSLSSNQIPDYKEVMALAKGKPINIEIKSQGNQADDEQLIDYIIKDIKKRRMEDCVLISSISPEAIQYVSRAYPKIPTGQVFWVKASTFLPFDFLTANLYREIEESQADYLMLHAVNRFNLASLLSLKPEGKTIVFWDFGDTMHLVHKDPTDQLWNLPRKTEEVSPIRQTVHL